MPPPIAVGDGVLRTRERASGIAAGCDGFQPGLEGRKRGHESRGRPVGFDARYRFAVGGQPGGVLRLFPTIERVVQGETIIALRDGVTSALERILGGGEHVAGVLPAPTARAAWMALPPAAFLESRGDPHDARASAATTAAGHVRRIRRGEDIVASNVGATAQVGDLRPVSCDCQLSTVNCQ